MTREEERRLVERCLAGEPAAWADFVARHTPLIAAKARQIFVHYFRRGPGPGEVEDVVQEVFERLARDSFRLLRKFQWRSSLTTYLWAIAANVSRKILEKERRAAGAGRTAWEEALAGAVAEERPPERVAIGKEEAAQLEKAIASLSGRDRLIVRMYFWGGAPPSRISKALGMDPAHVCVALSRALARMRPLLEGGC